MSRLIAVADDCEALILRNISYEDFSRPRGRFFYLPNLRTLDLKPLINVAFSQQIYPLNESEKFYLCIYRGIPKFPIAINDMNIGELSYSIAFRTF